MALTQIPIELSSTPGIVDNSNATAITIDSSENVLVGTTSTAVSSSTGSVTGAVVNNTGLFEAAKTGTVMELNRLTADGTILNFRKDGSAVGSIGSNSGLAYYAGSDIGIKFSSTQLRPSNSSGNNLDNTVDLGKSDTRFKDLYLSGGAYLGGTGAANKLDDYEEGTWTPISDSAGYTLSSASGTYTKVGRLVTVHFVVRFSAVPTANSTVLFTGQPFVSTNNTFHQPGICRETDTSGAIYVLQVNYTNDKIAMNSMDGVSNGSQRTIRTNENYNCFVCYTTSA